MKSTTSNADRFGAAKRWAWFVALWFVGVGGAALLALPFKLIIASAGG